MFCDDAWTAMRRVSRVGKMAVCTVVALCFLYSAAMLVTNVDDDPVAGYSGFMRMCAATAVLPMALVVVYLFSVRYDALNRVRRNPYRELQTNIVMLAAVSFMTSAFSTLLFVVIEVIGNGGAVMARLWSSALMMLVQLVMMNVSVGLFVLVLVNSGFSFNHVLPVVITVLLLANWFLLPFAGHLERYVLYFWYPLGSSWSLVTVQQVIPFCGYCIVLVLANGLAFEHTDRLEA